MAQESTGTNSNTYKDIRPKRGFRYRFYSYTINHPQEDDEIALNELNNKAIKHMAQKEVGSCGTVHIQGTIGFRNPRDFSSMKKKLPRAHIEATRNIEASFKYCAKEEGKITELYRKGIPKPVKTITELYDWQKKIIEIIKSEPDDRTINWYVDYDGAKGKTALCKYICLNYNALYLTGKSSDIKHLVSCHFDKDESNKDNIIFLIDLTRSTEGYISYQAIEELKNGIFMNTKYETKQCIFNSPHIFIFSNYDPELDKLSGDRWNIVYL